MNKVRIVFNSHNADAMLATAIIIEAIKATEKEDTKYSIETVPHSPVNYTAPNAEYDFVFCVGAHMNGVELLEESRRTKNLFHISYGTDQTGGSLIGLLGPDVHVFTPYHMWGAAVEGEAYSVSLSKLAIQASKRYFSIYEEETPNDTLRLKICSAFEKYCQNETISAYELNLVHENLDGISTSAHDGTLIDYKDVEKKVEFKNSVRTIKARSIITKGLSSQLYGTQKSSLMVQTLNCSEEYIHDLVRLISFAVDYLVLYQDIKHARQFWIYAKNPAMAEEISKLIPHYRSHKDGNIVYLVSDMPSMLSK